MRKKMFDFDDFLRNFFENFGDESGGNMPPGKTTKEEFINDGKKYIKETFVSDDGFIVSTKIYAAEYDDDITDVKNPIEKLTAEMDALVQEERFEEAIVIRDKIKTLTENSDKIFDLKNRLAIAIQSEDFESAIEIREELKKYNA
jgi:excinuclease UvrABC helicase subunit UvrB